MSFFFHHPQETQMKCPHCHEDICSGERTLFMGEQPFHRNCWIRILIGPTQKDKRGITARQEADAVVVAWQKRVRLGLSPQSVER